MSRIESGNRPNPTVTPEPRPTPTPTPTPTARPTPNTVPADRLAAPQNTQARAEAQSRLFGIPVPDINLPDIDLPDIDLPDLPNPLAGPIEGAKRFLGNVLDAFNADRNIDALGPNDRYTVGVGGNGSLEGGKIYGKGEIEVKRNENGTYTVSVGGEVGGGIYGQLGGSAGGSVSAEGEATLGAGGKLEMTFQNAEDAKRAVGLLAREGALAAGKGALAGMPGGPVVGQALDQVFGISDADRAFLASNVTAVELKGNVAGQVKAALGVADGDTNVVGGQVGLNVKEEGTVRLEFSNGRPSAVVVKGELSGEVSGNVGIGAMVGQAGRESGAGQGPVIGGSVKDTLSIERRFELPPDLSGSELLRDPVGTIREVAGHANANQSFKVTIAAEAQGLALGLGGGREGELSFSGQGSPEALLTGGALREAIRGNPQNALRMIGDQVKVDYTVRNFSMGGFSAQPELKIMGVGVGFEVKGQRKDVQDPPVFQFSGTGTEAAQRLLGGGAPQPAPAAAPRVSQNADPIARHRYTMMG